MSTNRLVHAITWVNALGVGPRLNIRNLDAHFKSGVLLCVILERVARPKPVFTALNYRPLAKRMALANLEMVRLLSAQSPHCVVFCHCAASRFGCVSRWCWL